MLDELRDFCRDVVGFTVGERPPFRRFGYRLCSGGRPAMPTGNGVELQFDASEPAG